MQNSRPGSLTVVSKIKSINVLMLLQFVTNLGMWISGFLYQALRFKNIFVASGKFQRERNTIL